MRYLGFPNYLRAFGLFHGARLFAAVEPQFGRNDVLRVAMPSPFHALYLRNTVGDKSIFWQVFVKREYEFSGFRQAKTVDAAYHRALKEGRPPLIIDAGGNIGLAAIWFATKYPKAVVYSIEPDPSNFEMLTRNVKPYANVVPLAGAVWPNAATLSIANPESGATSFHCKETVGGGVHAYTIPELIRLASATEVLIAKIDIEGGEEALFRENTDWVGRTHLLVVELHDWLYPWEGKSRPFFSCLSRFAADYLFCGENVFCFQQID